MRHTFHLLACAFLGGALFLSCQQDDAVNTEKLVSRAVLDRIWELGYSNENVQKIEEGYLVEGDIILTEENLKGHDDHTTLRIAETEQYRTTNLVTAPRTITVSIDTRLTDIPGYSAALDVVIARYDAENLTIDLNRGGSSGGDIHLKKQGGGFLASAGFPSGGNPSSGFTLSTSSCAISYLSNSDKVDEVMAHEIGHCIGFRHTDYKRRNSCGPGPGESAGSIGAVHIPGTPTNVNGSYNSWMMACTNGSPVFNADDNIALRYVY